MNIVTVYPIIRGAFKEELTYWSAHEFTPGTIIEVPLRGRPIPALVGSTSSASHAKANIRQASYVTKKIEKKKERMVVLPECIRACEKVAAYHVTPLGATLKACIPDIILASADSAKKIGKKITAQKLAAAVTDADVNAIITDATASNTATIGVQVVAPKTDEYGRRLPTGTAADILVYQTDTADRIGTYKSIVREEFARKKSVLIIAPTVVASEELVENVSKGIEARVVLMHGSLSKQKQLAAWKKILESDNPTLIVATPHFSAIPRKDISTIIIERESSRGYMSVRAPYIDYRYFIEAYAKALGARIILGDTFLRVETLFRRESGEIADFFPLSYRIEKSAEIISVDLKAKEKEEKAKFKIMSEELHSMIEHVGKKSEKMFIFTARRGLSPQTVCGDCGFTVECPVCKAPIVLHQGKERFFLCHHCGNKRGALEGCVNCGSWKLVTLGIGLDTVSEEIKKDFPKRPIFKLDKDSASTDKQARDTVALFLKSKDGILLGTESSLSFLPELPYSAIASLDSLFSIPDFRINERICHIVLRMLEKTSFYLLIQTRNSSNTVLKHLTSGTLLNFYKEEIDMRRMVNYPPFSVHIKVTVEDSRAEAAEKMKQLQDMVAAWGPVIFPAFVPTPHGKSVLHMLISVPLEKWPDQELRSTLTSLPREYVVKVNPESLL